MVYYHFIKLAIIFLIYLPKKISNEELNCYECVYQNLDTSLTLNNTLKFYYSENTCKNKTNSSSKTYDSQILTLFTDCPIDDNIAITYTDNTYGSQEFVTKTKIKLKEVNNLFNPSNFSCFWRYRKASITEYDTKVILKTNNIDDKNDILVFFVGYYENFEDTYRTYLLIDGKNDQNFEKSLEYFTEIVVFYYSKKSKNSLPFEAVVKEDDGIELLLIILIAVLSFLAFCLLCFIFYVIFCRSYGFNFGRHSNHQQEEEKMKATKEEFKQFFMQYKISNKVAINQYKKTECFICTESFEDNDNKDLFYTDCDNFIHFSCFEHYLETTKTLKCPFCHRDLEKKENVLKPPEINPEVQSVVRSNKELNEENSESDLKKNQIEIVKTIKENPFINSEDKRKDGSSNKQDDNNKSENNKEDKSENNANNVDNKNKEIQPIVVDNTKIMSGNSNVKESQLKLIDVTAENKK